MELQISILLFPLFGLSIIYTHILLENCMVLVTKQYILLYSVKKEKQTQKPLQRDAYGIWSIVLKLFFVPSKLYYGPNVLSQGSRNPENICIKQNRCQLSIVLLKQPDHAHRAGRGRHGTEHPGLCCSPLTYIIASLLPTHRLWVRKWGSEGVHSFIPQTFSGGDRATDNSHKDLLFMDLTF